MCYDFLIVGAGLTGCVFAERLASKNRKVLLIDKRSHIGGNCYDYYDSSGVLVHKYGPHIFHTNYDLVFQYLSNFTKWRKFELVVKAYVNERLYDFPINRSTLTNFFGVDLSSDAEAEIFLNKIKHHFPTINNSEELVLSQVGSALYSAFFYNYTKKQWNRSPAFLDASVCGRIPVRFNLDSRYFADKYQAMPQDGYHVMFGNMLDNKNIDLHLGLGFDEISNKIKYNYIIYTGCIDSFYDFKFGQLDYRSLKFEHETYDSDFFQDYCSINYPNDYEFTRIVEIKHATGQNINKTTIVKEFPSFDGEPYYPVPSNDNQLKYELYKNISSVNDKILFFGRLGEYKYLNMDQCVFNALHAFDNHAFFV